MSAAELYRTKAAQLAVDARSEGHGLIRSELLNMAQAYLRLAEQADRNSHLDMVYETPPHASNDGPSA